MGITACLIIGSMSGCSSKENGNSQSNQKEQTIQTNQTEEEISENEDVKNEEELQPTTVTVDYPLMFSPLIFPVPVLPYRLPSAVEESNKAFFTV